MKTDRNKITRKDVAIFVVLGFLMLLYFYVDGLTLV